jgi:uncharacterized phage-associated protein
MGRESRAAMPASAIDVAKYLILLAKSEEESELLSPMQLQKLLYYTQGWSLALRKEPMFDERIEAWAYGPVVKEVFQAFRRFADGPINPDLGSDENLSDEQKEFIGAVWQAYKGYSAIGLSEMTHREAPWKDARAGLPVGARSNALISRKTLKEFFEKQSRK